MELGARHVGCPGQTGPDPYSHADKQSSKSAGGRPGALAFVNLAGQAGEGAGRRVCHTHEGFCRKARVSAHLRVGAHHRHGTSVSFPHWHSFRDSAICNATGDGVLGCAPLVCLTSVAGASGVTEPWAAGLGIRCLQCLSRQSCSR